MKLYRSLFPVPLLLLAFVLTFGPLLPAQETPAAPATPAEKKTVEAPPPPGKPDEAAAPAAVTPPAADQAPAAAKADDEDATADKMAPKASESEDKPGQEVQEKTAEPEKTIHRLDGKKRKYHHRSSNDAPPFGDHTVTAGQKAGEAVSVFGSTTVDGDASDAAVSVFGNTTVNGTVGDAAVSVFGTTTINGTVKGEAVAVFGNIILGPKAVVEGDLSVVFGRVERDPGAQVHGSVNAVGGLIGGTNDFTWLRAYVTKCVLWGRPLWFGENLGWAWLVAAGFLVLYMLIALLFPRGIERSVETLEQRPGGTILAALLTMLLTPVLIVLLCITVVGIALIPFLSVGLFFGGIFGKAAVHAWIGRRVTNQLGDGPMKHVAVSVFFGGLIIMLLYLVPVLGFLLWKMFGVLGLGMVVFRLILSMQREKPAKAAAGPTAAVPPLLPGDPQAAVAATALPPVISASTLERAGFWIRLGASLLDLVMVGILCGFLSKIFHQAGGAFPLWYAVYCVILWATKGSTIGGIICGLKVVRLDDRPVDWGVAIVRALGGFLSLVVAGLGFIWVGFDDERQSWHDKIAGTTIVRVPKGTSLV